MLNPLPNAPALIDQVHDQLVAAISAGDLAPGLRLTQESVAALLGVSRQPVSHALQILKRRGLLIEHGKRGLAVAPLERERIKALYQVRNVLDGLAARLAAERCRQGDNIDEPIAAFRQALDAGEALTGSASQDLKQLVKADVGFHEALHKLSGNPEIARTVAEQWPQFMRSMGFVLRTDDHAATVWAEHRAIAEAVFAGDADRAEEAVRIHTTRAARNALLELPSADAAA